MASRKLVGYEYFAAGLGLKVETIRIYRSRQTNFPAPVNPGQRSPLFDQAAADRYIAGRLKGAAIPRSEMPEPLRVDLSDLVDFAYIASELQISVATAYKYGTPGTPQHIAGFPTPVTSESFRTTLFKRTEVDAFIARRRAAGATEKGRLRVAVIDDAARAAALEVNRLVGRDVDLESRAQLHHLLFTELELPTTPSTKRGPSVSTAALQELFDRHPHPVLEQILVYRGITVRTVA